MALTAHEVFDEYLAAQASGDGDKLMRLIAHDAIFDVGRGRYIGDDIRQFHERLQSIHSKTTVIEVRELGHEHITALLDQYDDDLKPLGIDKIQLEADIHTNSEGRIHAFSARPTPASLKLIAAARDTGRSSEGVKLAEQAGTLSPSAESLEKK